MSFSLRRRWLRRFSSPSPILGRPRPSLGLHLEGLEERTLLSSSIPLSSTNWTNIGPAPVDAGEPFTGRITAIATNPTDVNTLYVGEAGGGVWKTTDGGTHWLPLTDDQASPNIGAIALAPSNPNVVYVGTGEANMGPSKAAISRFNIFYGEGVLRSTDGGSSWVLEGNSIFHRRSISRIVVDHNDANIVYVAVGYNSVNGLPGNTGVWKSTNGGQTWTDTTSAISTTAAVSDLAMDPTNSRVLYAAVGDPNGDLANGLWKTTDGGNTWSRSGNFPTGADTNVGRVMVAVSNSSPQILYATIAHSGPAANLYEQLRSADGGATWTALNNTPDYLAASLPTGPSGFGDYDISLAVDPSDANRVYAGGTTNGGTNFIESIDGGNNWTEISFGVQEPGGTFFIHGDEHAIAFDAQGRLVEGNDGGIWRLDDPTPGSQSWTDINGNLSTIQVEGLALDPTNPDIAYVGAQDNGIEKFNDSLVWPFVGFGGDGGNQLVDFSNPQTVYYDAAVGSYGSDFFVQRSRDGGQNYGPIVNGITAANEPTIFYPPFVMDPANSHRLLLGTGRVYETTDQGDDWTPISDPLARGWTATGAITALSAAKTSSGTIYAAADAHIFVTFNDGQTWFQRDIPGYSDLSKDFYKDIAVDPTNNLVAYAVRDRFTGSPGGHVFKTTDGGQTWTDISLPQGGTVSALPDTPTTAIRVDARTQILYVGTDIGVYFSSDGGLNWQVMGVGMPHARVDKLDLSTITNILAAGTNGRGVWEIQVPSNLSGTGTLQFAASSYTINESAGSVTITVTRQGGADGTVAVRYQTQDDTAQAGADYTPAVGVLTFGPGETTKSFTVQIPDDQGGEDDSVFRVNLSQIPGGGSLGSPSSVPVTILETDFGSVQFAVASTVVSESAGSATIRVVRVGGSDHTVTVNYATSDGTARAGTDYTAVSGTLTFAAGEKNKTFTVPILDDGGNDEPDETINLTLTSSGGGAQLGSPTSAILSIHEASAAGGSGLPVDLVNDINPGADGSAPGSFANVNGILYFVADDGATGRELWKTDGTAAGTQLVKDINPGDPGSDPSSLVNVAGTLYFAASNGNGVQLWKSNGTPEGTVPVALFQTRPEELTAVGTRVYFTANNFGSAGQLWVSDGSPAATTEVTSFVGRPDSSSDRIWLTNVNGTLFFSADLDDGFGDEVHKTDGTPGGTVLVRDVNPFPYFGFYAEFDSSNATELVNVGGVLYFSADNGEDGRELWRSDGSSSGTTMVKDIFPGFDQDFAANSSSPHDLVAIGNEIYFLANDGVHGDELWKSDGSAGGTRLVKDVNPGPSSSQASQLTSVGGTLFFEAISGGYGNELWSSDGTSLGTELVKDINPAGSASPTGLINVNGLLYFSADDGSQGAELWRSDGTAAGTQLVNDTNQGSAGSAPANLTMAGTVLFFSANDGTEGTELWRVNNLAPTISFPGPQLVTQGQTLTFSAALNTGFSVGDTDLGSGAFEVTVSATAGLVTLGSRAGITVTRGTGTGDATVTFRGGPDAVNTALNGLTFQATGAPSDIAGVTLAVNDLGNSGFGGPQTTTVTVPITIAPPEGGGGGGGTVPPPLTGAALATAGIGAGETLYALTVGHDLYRHVSSSGWVKLGGNIASITASTESSGRAVVFVVTRDKGLFRFSDATGWQMFGAPGTVVSATAGTDTNGLADAFVITSAGDFTEFRSSSGWRTSPLGARGTVLSAAAGDQDRVAVVTADHSVFQFDPKIGWFRMTSAGFAQSLSAAAGPDGRLSVFAVTVTHGLFWHDGQTGWHQIGAAQTIADASAGHGLTGAPSVWVVTAQGDLAGFDTARGWNSYTPPATPSGIIPGVAAAASDRVFMDLADGSIVEHDDTFGFFALTGPGFLGS